MDLMPTEAAGQEVTSWSPPYQCPFWLLNFMSKARNYQRQRMKRLYSPPLHHHLSCKDAGVLSTHPEHGEAEERNALPTTYYFLKNFGKFVYVLDVNVGRMLTEKKNSSSPHWWILHLYSLKGLLCFQCTQHTSTSAPFLIFAWHGKRFLESPPAPPNTRSD